LSCLAGDVQAEVIMDAPSSAPAAANVRKRFMWASPWKGGARPWHRKPTRKLTARVDHAHLIRNGGAIDQFSLRRLHLE